MAVKVLRVGNINDVDNPVDNQTRRVQNITFAEWGREGADDGMSETNEALSIVLGKKIGLENIRVHTHPLPVDEAQPFVDGFNNDPEKVYEGLFINRKMHSLPQIPQQVGVMPRLIDNRPTFFTTYLSTTKKDDIDLRMSNESLMRVKPEYFTNAQVGAAKVTRVETVQQGPGGQQPAQKPTAVEHDDLTKS